MAKISERLLSKNVLREKRRDSLDPQRVNMLSEDSICMVNFMETPRVIVFFLTWLTCFGCSKGEVLFRKANIKIKMSPLLVHC